MTAKNKIISTGFAVLSIALIAVGARFDRSAVALDPSAVALLEQHIPFSLETRREIAPEDDALDLNVVVQLDEKGRDLEYTWRAMDGDTTLLECGDFYDLYYRCEAPSLFNVRVITLDHTGQQVSSCQGIIAIN